MWLRQLDEWQATSISDTEGSSSSPFFSADGQSIGFYADGQLKKASVTGGAPVPLVQFRMILENT